MGLFYPTKMGLCFLLSLFIIGGCAIAPRVGLWDAPKRFTKNEVFGAVVQAGLDHGLHLTTKDKDLGIVAFRFRAGKAEGSLNFQLKEEAGQIKVRTSTVYGGDIAIAGELENNIRIIHKSIFSNLNITDPLEKNVKIEILNN